RHLSTTAPRPRQAAALVTSQGTANQGTGASVTRWRSVTDVRTRSNGSANSGQTQSLRRSDQISYGSAWTAQGSAPPLHDSVPRALDPPGALPLWLLSERRQLEFASRSRWWYRIRTEASGGRSGNERP